MTVQKLINLTKEQYEQVTLYLEQPKATKKAACEMLGITYNTKRLQELIERYETRTVAEAQARANKRKQQVTQAEVVSWITSYLNGESTAQIAEHAYRSEAVVKLHLEKNSAMLRQRTSDRLNPALLPEVCMADSFEPGQYVWSAAYNCVAIVVKEYKNAYRIHVLSNDIQEFSYQPASELGNLQHLADLGVNLSGFVNYMKGDEVRQTVNEAVRNANKRAGKE